MVVKNKNGKIVIEADYIDTAILLAALDNYLALNQDGEDFEFIKEWSDKLHNPEVVS